MKAGMGPVSWLSDPHLNFTRRQNSYILFPSFILLCCILSNGCRNGSSYTLVRLCNLSNVDGITPLIPELIKLLHTASNASVSTICKKFCLFYWMWLLMKDNSVQNKLRIQKKNIVAVWHCIGQKKIWPIEHNFFTYNTSSIVKFPSSDGKGPEKLFVLMYLQTHYQLSS